jgi:very-short-patch-repair endonuclease
MCSISIAQRRLAIEIDGMSHDVGDRPERDLRRNAWLEARGVTVMRIPARELTKSIDEAVDAIMRTAAALVVGRAPSTALTRGPPPPLCEGG